MSVRRSIAWSYAGQASTFAIGVVSSIILARLLRPHDFGLFALAQSIVGLLGLIASVGLPQFLIREQELDQQTLRAAFTANLIVQGAIALPFVAVALLVAPSLGQGLQEVMLLIALTGVSNVVEFIPRSVLQREMRFKAIASTGVINAAVSALVAIPLARQGWGAVSIAAGLVAGKALSSAVLVAVRPTGALMWPTFRGLRAVLVYGAQMLSITGLSQAASRAGDLVLARLQGVAGLGTYSRAAQLHAQLFYIVYGLATGVLFAKLSEDFRRTGEIRQVYLRSVEMLTGVLWPVSLGLAILARPVVRLVYGPAWSESALPLSLLMVAMAINLAVAMNWELFVLRKETARQARYEITRSAVGLAAFVAGSWWSVAAAAAARVFEAIVSYALYAPSMPRMIGCTRGELRAMYGRSAGATACAVLPSLGLMLANGFDPLTGPGALAAAIGGGIALWAVALVALRHALADEARLMLASLARRRAAPLS